MTDLFGRHAPHGWDGYIPGLWDIIEHCLMVDAITDEEYEDLRKVFDALADYEHRITWDTTCEQCANTLDLAVEQTFRAEEVEQQLKRVCKVADKWKEYAEWSQAGVEGTGGPNRPRMYWDVAADRVYDALEGRDRMKEFSQPMVGYAEVVIEPRDSLSSQTECCPHDVPYRYACEVCDAPTDKPAMCSACFGWNHEGHPDCCWECGEAEADD